MTACATATTVRAAASDAVAAWVLSTRLTAAVASVWSRTNPTKTGSSATIRRGDRLLHRQHAAEDVFTTAPEGRLGRRVELDDASCRGS